MEVRTAGDRDVEDLARLRAVWRGQPASADYLATFRDWFRRERDTRWWWVATEADRCVGMVNLKLFERMPAPDRPHSRWGYLSNLFVDADHRGAGAGAALVAAAVDRARREQLVRIVLSPSERAVPLYARHGFRPAGDLLLLPFDG